MQISKRNGTVEAYEAGKIKRAMGAAFASVGTVLDDDEADRLIARIERAMATRSRAAAAPSRWRTCRTSWSARSWRRTTTRS